MTLIHLSELRDLSRVNTGTNVRVNASRAVSGSL